MSETTHTLLDAAADMVEAHGEGPLAKDIRRVKQKYIPDVPISQPSRDEAEQTSRRIAACLKACEHFDLEWLERNNFDDYALYTKDEHAHTVVDLRRMKAGLELIAQNHDGHETFSGTRCAEIAKESLPDCSTSAREGK